MGENKIAWQNKDIISKAFAENLKGKSLEVYGIHVPEVVDVLPTNLPSIQANEMRLDNAFLLKDQSIALIDYESTYSENDKLDYIDYASRVLRHYRKEWGREIQVRMIVIYTADVTREQASTDFDAGCLKLHIDAAFLSELDAEGIRRRISAKILAGEPLTDQEKMEFVILPMSYKGNRAKNAALEENISLAEHVTGDAERVFLLTGMAVFANKVIDETLMARIERMVTMTRLGQRYADRMQKAIEEAVAGAKAEIAEANAKTMRAEARAAEAEAEIKVVKATAEAEAKAAEAEAKAAEAEAKAAEAEAKAAKAEAKAAKAEAEAKALEAEKQMAKALLENGLPFETILKCSTFLTWRALEELRAAILEISRESGKEG